MGKKYVKIWCSLAAAAFWLLGGLPLAMAAVPDGQTQTTAAVRPAAAQEMRRVRLQWPAVPGAVKYQLVVLRSAEDRPDNILTSLSTIYINGYELDTAGWGPEKQG